MKAGLRCTPIFLHQRRDKGGNAHNFPFDTLTKVYRDTIYATQPRHQRHPMFPERGPDAAVTGAAPLSSDHASNVTNHVGNTGVMSPAATKLSDWMAEQQQQQQQYAGMPEDHLEGSARHEAGDHAPNPTATHTHASRITRPVASSSSAAVADDEAVRRRLRTHLFMGKKDDRSRRNTSSGTAGLPAPRHSGVQVEILNLYRSMLREVRRMDDADTQRHLVHYIRAEFEKHREVPRKNILKIEWQLNYGKRKLEDLQSMGRRTKFSVMR